MSERNERLASSPAHHAPSGSTCWQPIKDFSVERDVSVALQFKLCVVVSVASCTLGYTEVITIFEYLASCMYAGTSQVL
jgi:hypothetical protein